MTSHQDEAPSPGPRIVGPAKPSAFSATATFSAKPTVFQQATTTAQPTPFPSASTSAAYVPAMVGFGSGGRTIVPPSMTLDEGDVNGFRASAAGKKANRNNKKRGPNKGTAKREDPSLSYHPSVVYEVGKPCDYVSAKHTRRPVELACLTFGMACLLLRLFIRRT